MDYKLEERGLFGRKLYINIPAADFNQLIEKKLAKLSKNAKLKGFRPGKVPLQVMQRHFGKEVKEEATKELVNDSFNGAIEQYSLRTMVKPQFDDMEIDDSKGIRYTAYVEVMPDLQLKTLAGISIEKPAFEISEGDVDKMVEQVRQAHGKWQAKTSAAQRGDRVEIKVLRRNTEDTAEDAADEGSVDEEFMDEYYDLGCNLVGPGFDEQLEDMQIGDSKEVEVDYPPNYPNAELAGVAVRFRVRVKSIQERIVPQSDAELLAACQLKDLDIAGFRRVLRSGMESEAQKKSADIFRWDVMAAACKANPLEVPPLMLEEALASMRKDLRRNNRNRAAAAQQDAPQEDESQQQPPPTELEKKLATQRTHQGLIVLYFADKYKLRCDRQSFEAKLDSIAKDYSEADAVKEHYRSDEQARQQLEVKVIEDKVMNHLTEKAVITPKAYSYQEVMDATPFSGGRNYAA